MIFEPLPLAGSFRIRLEKREDARGSFARTFCAREFQAHGLNTSWPQCNTSFNRARGTLRGLHWTKPGEDKLVRVTRGSLWDVLVDLRPESPTFRRWHGETLDADNGVQLYIPRGFAHGFVTLADATEIFYQMASFYDPKIAHGARYDDPAFNIQWPISGGLTVSDGDLHHPPFQIGN